MKQELFNSINEFVKMNIDLPQYFIDLDFDFDLAKLWTMKANAILNNVYRYFETVLQIQDWNEIVDYILALD